MKLSTLMSLYWSASVENIMQIVKTFDEALERAVVVSKSVIEKYDCTEQSNFIDLKKSKVKRIYMTLSGNVVTVDDMTSIEIKEAVKCNACIEVIVVDDREEDIDITLYYGEHMMSLIESSIVNLNDVMNEYRELVNGITGEEIQSLAEFIDSNDDEEVLNGILNVIRTYAIKNKKTDLLKSDSRSKAADKVISEMLANYVYSQQK